MDEISSSSSKTFRISPAVSFSRLGFRWVFLGSVGSSGVYGVVGGDGGVGVVVLMVVAVVISLVVLVLTEMVMV